MLKIEMIGHLGKAATINQVNGKSVINFSVAHSEKYKDRSGNNVEKTIWVGCSYWVDNTSIAQYLTVGKQVYIEGQPESRMYQGADGKSKVELACRVFKIQLLGGVGDRQQQPQTNQSANPSTSSQQYQNADDITQPMDDLPF